MAKRTLEKPTKAMRDRAIRALDSIVTDPTSPHHAKVRAAQTLARPDRDDEDDDAEREPPMLLILPDNGRNPEITKLGITVLPGYIRILYNPLTAEGLADRDRWEAEARAQIAHDFPEILALAAPVPALPAPPRLTDAQRMKAFRARRKLEAAATAAAAAAQ